MLLFIMDRASLPHRATAEERLLALRMLRDLLNTLLPSIPEKMENEELVDFLLTPETMEVMQESVAKGRGMRKA